jgi:hypothetical protein
MTTIDANTFLEAKIMLQNLEEDVADLTVKLHSDFDAPKYYADAPVIP